METDQPQTAKPAGGANARIDRMVLVELVRVDQPGGPVFAEQAAAAAKQGIWTRALERMLDARQAETARRASQQHLSQWKLRVGQARIKVLRGAPRGWGQKIRQLGVVDDLHLVMPVPAAELNLKR